MKNVIQTHRVLFAGIVMSGMGFALMLIFSGQDILTPGFVETGLVIEDTEVKPQQSISGIIHIDMTGKSIALMLSSLNNPVVFEVQIDMPDGSTIHKEYHGGLLQFMPTSSGQYMISVKNLSLKSTVLRISYGYTEQDNTSIIYTALWLGLLGGGNYLIIHSRFISVSHSAF